jgi:hypothetical protein
MGLAEDPPSDDFFTPRFHGGIANGIASGQVDHYHHIRTHRSNLLRFWIMPPVELQAMSAVAIRILSLLATSASVERSFSTARRACGDYQMAMTQKTISARVMVQVNWRIAEPSLGGVLALGRSGWGGLTREREERLSRRDDPWRLEIAEEEDVSDGS